MLSSSRLAFFLAKTKRDANLYRATKLWIRAQSLSTTKKPHQTGEIHNNVDDVAYISTDYSNKMIFGSKNTSELVRAFFILTVSSIDWVVTYSDKILLRTRKILWQPMFDALLKRTFYGQFAAGTCIKTSEQTVSRLQNTGIRSMMMVPIETMTYETEEEEEEGLQSNYEILQDCIHGEAILESNGFSQMKLTALCNKELLLQMNKRLIDYETDHKEPGAWDMKVMSEYLEDGRYEDIIIPDLDRKMNKKLQELLRKIDNLASLCKENNVRMMIDAEQTYIQAALGYLVLLLQAKYNKQDTIVYNTYQCFRKDTLSRIKADYILGMEMGFKVAGKLVRGAYMVEERRLAKENGYPDPINHTFDETSKMYHSCVDFLLPMIIRGDAGIMIATHNEDTVDFVINRMDTHNISKSSNYLCFGQIYGMCDHVSYYLAKEGYKPFKSVPYGAIDDTLLYLTRRAQENRSVMARTKLERQMIMKELMQRTGKIFSLRK